MDWRDRFRAPAVVQAEVARSNPDRGVVISDVGGRFQACAWDRAAGSINQVTSSETAVISAAISPDGRWIYAMVEDEPGSEVGHLHRFPFEGGPSTSMTPGLDPYTSFVFKATGSGVAALVGMDRGQAFLLASGGDPDVIPLPSVPITLVVSADGTKAVVTLATPGEGLVPMLRLLSLPNGEVIGEAARMRADALSGDRVAVSVVDGDWMRPGIWDGRAVDPIEVEAPGDLVPSDWSSDGSTILLTQSYRSRSALFLYEVATGSVTPLPSPPGGIYPPLFGWPASLVARDRAISIWSDANHSWRVFELTADGFDVALHLDNQGPFPGPSWEEFTFPSTGGVEIQGWLLRPGGEGPWPTVIYTHGGPSSVAGPTFVPLCSAWLDEGFAVASINYRGSVTFGESFREALTGNIGGPDVEDVIAAYHWLVDNGIADPKRVIKNGYSYGGYLTLQSLGTHPDLWAAGVAGAPVADWALMYEDANDMLRGYQLSLFGGAPDELAEAYRRASPRTYAADYRAPILISQPESDSRTPIRPVRQFVDDLKAVGKQVELRLLPGGHAGSGKEQTIQMVESWLAFAGSVLEQRSGG